MKIVKSAEAAADIVEAAKFIAEDNLNAALQFAEAVDESLNVLASFPTIGAIREFGDLGEFRMWIVKGFPNYLLFYKTTATEITLVRLIHSARDFNRIFED